MPVYSRYVKVSFSFSKRCICTVVKYIHRQGFSICYRGKGWWDTGTWWVQYGTNKLAGNSCCCCCCPLQAGLSVQLCADIRSSALVRGPKKKIKIKVWVQSTQSQVSRGAARQAGCSPRGWVFTTGGKGRKGEEGGKSNSRQISSAPSVAVGRGQRSRAVQPVPPLKCLSPCTETFSTLKSNPSHLQHNTHHIIIIVHS